MIFLLKGARGAVALVGAVIIMASSWVPAEAAPGSQDAAFVDFSAYGRWGLAGDATDATLTIEEERILQAAVEAADGFPTYLFSGCHDRAHALFMMMPAALRPKLMKIWLVSPERSTLALAGTIRLADAVGPAQRVTWGYHVALAYRSSTGIRVFDAGLAPGHNLSREAWAALLDVPPLTFWTLTKGELYNFVGTEKVADASNQGNVFNGGWFEYNGGARAENWIPGNLARDAVGEAALAGRGCSRFRALAEKPGELASALSVEVGQRQADCTDGYALYDETRARWIERLADF